ncbi:MAG: acyl-CoA dehydrogenase [Deltaproteobacteria bacterium]|jgi:alkylation response protein AidB-like acyl-CoA dehydrogenase|nr:acyl-CoA dehydrogenase [Deltaproteobacteria bacterium]
MDFAFSEEQDEFREMLRRFFEEKAPSSEVRRMSELPEGFDRAVWKQMAEELGLQGVHVPEGYGGQGFGFLELGIVLEEMGRVLLPSPFLASSVLATCAILNAGAEEQRAALLPGLASGERIAALALAEDGVGWEPRALKLEAVPEGSGFRLSGSKGLVLDGQVADRLIVAARLPGTEGDDGITLCVVSADDSGLKAAPQEPLDPTRRLARIELDGARGEALGVPGEGAAPLARTLAQGAIALSAEMVGGAARCLDMSVDYAKVRVQFAKPIGTFQAIKHKAAEVLLDLELARAAAYWAWWVADEDRDELQEAAHLAKATCAEAFHHAARENIQIHGGIGFTWEHDAHLYYKRATADDTLFGDATEHRSKLADLLGA